VRLSSVPLASYLARCEWVICKDEGRRVQQDVYISSENEGKKRAARNRELPFGRIKVRRPGGKGQPRDRRLRLAKRGGAGRKGERGHKGGGSPG
jgi:hypothetical protein